MGGIAEVYKPEGRKTYVYDINSLYPYIMKTCAMPCGPPIFTAFDKNTNDDFSNFFGFIQAEIETPKEMYVPVLCIKDGGMKTPLGK